MRIAYLGNPTGLGLTYARAIRRLGHDARLFISVLAEQTANPREGGLEPAEEGLLQEWNRGARTEWRDDSGFAMRIRRRALTAVSRLRLAARLRQFDVTHSFGKEAVFARPTARRLVAQATGAELNELILNHVRGTSRSLEAEILLRVYRSADVCLLSTVEQVGWAADVGLRATYQPMPIDTDFFSDTGQPYRNRFRVFGPARLDWTYRGPYRRGSSLKGNDVLIRGFAALVQERVDAELVLRDWGPDRDATRDLVRSLGLSDRVSYLPVVSKTRLAHEYRQAHVVVDQFVGGCLGVAALEALACERPVVMRLDAAMHRDAGVAVPPVLAATSGDDVAGWLLKLHDTELRSVLGRRSRDWVVEHHSAERVASQVLARYQALQEQSG